MRNAGWYVKQLELFKVYSFPRNRLCGFPPATESQVTLAVCGILTSQHPLFLEKWHDTVTDIMYQFPHTVLYKVCAFCILKAGLQYTNYIGVNGW